MNVTIVDYNSGNISSVINSFKEVAKDKVNIEVTSDLNKIKSSDKVVLPGQGSFKSCVDALNGINGLVETLNEFAIVNKKPLLGICVGLQMFADIGYEETETKGLGWISGKVSKIDNQNGKFKLPHIGWNQINILKDSNEEFESINYYEVPLTGNQLRELRDKGLSVNEMLRSNEPLAQRMNLAARDLSDDELIEIMVENPDLIQRPIVVRGEQAVLCRPPENVLKLL